MKVHILLFSVRHLVVPIDKPEGNIYFFCSTVGFPQTAYYFVDVIQNLSVHKAAEMYIKQLV